MTKVSQESEKFVSAGKVSSAQGLKGQVFLKIDAGEASWQKKLKTLWLSNPQTQYPEKSYSVVSLREHRKNSRWGLVVSLTGIDTREAAEALIGQTVYIPKDFLTSSHGQAIFLREIMGFQVIDSTRGDLGTICDFSGNGAQDLIVVKLVEPAETTCEVPLVQPILINIDFEKQQVLMDIPLGLVPGDE